MHLKMYFFIPFVRPCVHHKYGGISESHACKDCVWPIIMDAELYATCPGERALVVMTHQVQCNIPTFEALLRKNMYLFLERCRGSNNVWLPALMQSDCLYSSLLFEHYTRICFVTECSNIPVFLRLRAGLPDLIFANRPNLVQKRVKKSQMLRQGGKKGPTIFFQIYQQLQGLMNPYLAIY